MGNGPKRRGIDSLEPVKMHCVCFDPLCVFLPLNGCRGLEYQKKQC